MPLTDHTLILQNERAIEALSDRVDELDVEPADVHCDCDCADSDVDDLRGDLNAATDRLATLDDECSSLRSSMQEMSDILVAVTERLAVLEAQQ